jgi:hypothetical protein
MVQLTESTRKTTTRWLELGVFGVLFACSQHQFPLYTSNQNTYFAHGLAQGGYGRLKQDWFSQTADPTPIFSLLVQFVYRFLDERLFYAVHALLLCVYSMSILGIIAVALKMRVTDRTFIFTSLAIVLLHSDLPYQIWSTVLPASSYPTFLFGGLARQYLIRPHASPDVLAYLQPASFGVLLLLSIYLMLLRRPYPSLLAVDVAVLLHPTYAVIGVSLFVTYLVFLLRQGYTLREVTAPFALATSLALCMVAYVFVSFRGQSVETTLIAQSILIERFPWHARPDFFSADAISQLVIMGVALAMLFRSDLFPLLFLPAVLFFGLTVLQLLTNSTSLALLFPWRFSVVLLPIASSILLGLLVQAIARLGGRLPSTWRVWSTGALVAMTVSIIVYSIGVVSSFSAMPSRSFYDEIATFFEVEPSPMILVPVDGPFESFRLESGIPIFVDYKSHPYRDVDVIEWKRRVDVARGFYQQIEGEHVQCTSLGTMLREERITHIALPEGERRLESCTNLVESFRRRGLVVYQLLRDE